MKKQSAKGNRALKDLHAKGNSREIKGGALPVRLPSLDAGIHFGYDIKAQKEA